MREEEKNQHLHPESNICSLNMHPGATSGETTGRISASRWSEVNRSLPVMAAVRLFFSSGLSRPQRKDIVL